MLLYNILIPAVTALNARRSETGLAPLAFGAGVHTGPLVVGDLGATDRRQLTVVGDTVNTAARLESATKALGAPLVASVSTGVAERGDWTGPFQIDPPGTGPINVWTRADPSRT